MKFLAIQYYHEHNRNWTTFSLLLQLYFWKLIDYAFIESISIMEFQFAKNLNIISFFKKLESHLLFVT